MDARQLNELALNAQLDHWPPHLGVRTDAEKIEYLAQRLQEAANITERNEELEAELADEIEALKERIAELEMDFESKIDDLRNDLEKLEQEED